MLRLAASRPRFLAGARHVTYAIIKVAGKQYRVREGERLLVDRLREEDGTTFSPSVLLVGGDGAPALDPEIKVTARVLGAVKGPKIRIGKYKKRTGYRRHTGFRASLTQIEIESIGAAKRPARTAARTETKPEAKTEPAAASGGEHVKGMPSGYEELTVAEIKTAAAEWNSPMLAAALEYERANANRKGALAALESAIAAKEEK
jgi:large subunit ribosomal protein L21